MKPRPVVLTAAACLALILAGCGSEELGAPGEATDIEVTTPTAAPDKDFEIKDVDDLKTDKINGERIDDPGMKLTYTWQGTSAAPNGGTIAVVAVKNRSDVPMPAEVLGTPKLMYTSGGNNRESARAMTGEEAGIKDAGIDMPIGPGATVNVKYPFDVTMTNLWDASFTIGNVTFTGNLNN